MSDTVRDLYAEWQARYGPGAPEDLNRSFFFMDVFDWFNAQVWQWGVESCGSLDSTIVRDWLMAQPVVPHPMGDAVWGGEKVFGVNGSCFYDYPVSVVKVTAEYPDGVNETVGMFNIGDWLAVDGGKNADLVLKWMSEFGVVYD